MSSVRTSLICRTDSRNRRKMWKPAVPRPIALRIGCKLSRVMFRAGSGNDVPWRQECAAKVGLGFMLPEEQNKPLLDKSGQVFEVEIAEAAVSRNSRSNPFD
jgi:hypothetical protein